MDIYITNPVKVNKSSDLLVAQPITFESLLRAKGNYKVPSQINLLTDQYE